MNVGEVYIIKRANKVICLFKPIHIPSRLVAEQTGYNRFRCTQKVTHSCTPVLLSNTAKTPLSWRVQRQTSSSGLDFTIQATSLRKPSCNVFLNTSLTSRCDPRRGWDTRDQILTWESNTQATVLQPQQCDEYDVNMLLSITVPSLFGQYWSIKTILIIIISLYPYWCTYFSANQDQCLKTLRPVSQGHYNHF